MLLHLHVKNLALIEEAEMDFGPGLNILTGETGAGKSILLGSMQMILGSRVSKEMIRANESYALVELLFQVEDEKTRLDLEELGVDLVDGQVLLSRKLAGGKSINKINDETCTLNRMKDTASCLLDIHGQHEHQTLLLPERQLDILDAYGREKIGPAREKTKNAFLEYRRCCDEIKTLDIDQAARSREISFLEFEIDQIDKAALKEGEDEELEAQFRKMSNSRRILEAILAVTGLTGQDNEGAASLVGEACRQLRQIADLDPELEAMVTDLTQIDSLLDDFGRELERYQDQMTFQEEDYYRVSERLDLINGLKAKYGQSITEIFAYRAKQNARLEDLNSFEEKLALCRERQAAARKELDAACRELSVLRSVYGKELEEKIVEGLKDMNFLEVDFAIRFTKKKNYTETGFDEVEYLISTNPGEEIKPLAKIVSGGELSRIMLAIKAIMADKDHVETLIFDEIDTGISGRTAQKVSEKMAWIGRHHQVLCITHLPQIAAMADRHFEISKSAEGGKTRTVIRFLEEEASVKELSRLLSGAEVTDTVLDNAREMRRLAKAFKAEK